MGSACARCPRLAFALIEPNCFSTKCKRGHRRRYPELRPQVRQVKHTLRFCLACHSFQSDAWCRSSQTLNTTTLIPRPSLWSRTESRRYAAGALRLRAAPSRQIAATDTRKGVLPQRCASFELPPHTRRTGAHTTSSAPDDICPSAGTCWQALSRRRGRNNLDTDIAVPADAHTAIRL